MTVTRCKCSGGDRRGRWNIGVECWCLGWTRNVGGKGGGVKEAECSRAW